MECITGMEDRSWVESGLRRTQMPGVRRQTSAMLSFRLDFIGLNRATSALIADKAASNPRESGTIGAH
jgi:hypothetical protein